MDQRLNATRRLRWRCKGSETTAHRSPRRVAPLLFLWITLASGAQAAPVCTTPLLGFGPVSPVHGFPLYYQDSTLLGLQPCLDTICDPALALPDPNKPISFPNNFP